MSDQYIQAAFNAVIKDAKQPKGFYVSLMERVPYYGGPQEGGWWGSDTHIVAHQWFATEEEAETAKQAVSKLAEELAQDAKCNYGNKCLREMALCERLGVDADWLPEVDGESEYYVLKTEGIPQESRGCRHYE